MTHNFTEAETTKLKGLISDGIQVLTETDALKEGLKDTVTALAEEFSIKPAILNRAIRIAYKAEFTKKEEEFEELETILRAAGRNY